MDEKARQAQREYQRQWRQEHPDKVREYRRRYWERKAREGNTTRNTAPAAMIGGDRR